MAIKGNRGQGRGNGNGNNGGQGNGGGDGGGGDDDDDGQGDADLGKLVNDAVTAHLGRKLPSILGPMLAPLVAKSFTEAMPTLVEQIQTALGGQGQGGAAGAGAGGQQGAAGGAGQGQGGQQGAAGGQIQGGQDPHVKALMGQVSALTEQLKRQQEQTAAQEAEARNGRRDSMLAEGLSKLGVDKNRLRGAMAIARDAMTWDAEAATPTGGKGAWVWRAQRNGYHEDLTVDAGLGEWGKTDEGKSYIAAAPNLRQGGGGGHGSQQRAAAGGGGGRQQQLDPAAQRQQNAQAGADKLFGQVSEMLGGGSVSLGGSGGG